MKTPFATDPDADPVMERVKVALRASSLEDVAKALGVKRATVGSWSARSSVPLHALVRTTEIAKCSLDSLVFGHRPQNPVLKEGPAPWVVSQAVNRDSLQAGGAPGAGKSGILVTREVGAAHPVVLSLPLGESGGLTKEYKVIPRYSRAATAGNPKGEAEEAADQIDLAGDMAFSYAWFDRRGMRRSGKYSSVTVKGHSMAPTLLDGDLVMIDEDVTAVDMDGVYVFDYVLNRNPAGKRMVKRIARNYDGGLLLISDNELFGRQVVPPHHESNVKVIGRVVWPRVL